MTDIHGQRLETPQMQYDLIELSLRDAAERDEDPAGLDQWVTWRLKHERRVLARRRSSHN